MMPKFLFFCHLELSYFLNCAILFLTVKPTARYREGREHHGSGASSDAADPISGLSGKIRAGCPIEHSERPSQPG